jgi:chaperonin GroES
VDSEVYEDPNELEEPKATGFTPETAVGETNLTHMFDEEYLTRLGNQIKEDYNADEDSRSEWLKTYEKAMKIANQVYEEKSFPWEKASNIRFPLITIGAMQFHARAYPALLPSKGVVETGTIGIDMDGTKGLLAKLVAAHMNYQFQFEIKDWEEDMDKLLITLPITGCEFKKTYYRAEEGACCSEYVRSADLVVNYYAKSMEEAARKTHILSLSHNEVVELQRAGIFRECSMDAPEGRKDTTTKVFDQGSGFKPPAPDSSTPHKILEWHGFVDLDGDDYKEPYVVTVDEKSGKVLRIVARYYREGIKRENGIVTKIDPIEYFTKYDFIPNPSGGIYGIGFGILLGPINESVNTIINQLVDGGTLSNMQSGFISRNLRMRNGSFNFSPGKWMEVNASGADLRQGIMPLPVREPSMVLFQLLQTLISSGERLTSTTDMMVGENPGQNQKATTTNAVLDQGMKVFTAIYKRVRRAMTKEFQKVFDINYYYLDEEKTRVLFDGSATMQKKFYDKKNMVVFPSADPNIASSGEKQAHAQALLQMMQLGGFNEYEIKRRALDAMGVSDPESLLIPPEQQQPPPPDPKLLEVERKAKADQFQQQFDTVELMHTMGKDKKKLEIDEENAATKRLQAMLDGFAKGTDATIKSRALVQKEVQDRRKVDATKSKSQ